MVTALKQRDAKIRERSSHRDFERLYARLNERQRQAVDTTEGPVMVLAGPGTGKTQVLAMRIARILLSTQMDPWNILCLTFTESGVAAMRERLISIIGEAAYYVRIHTFHSFCNDIIQEFPEKFSAVRAEEVLSDIERVEIFRLLVDALPATSSLKPFGNPYLFLRDIMYNVQQLKQEGIRSEVLRGHLRVLEQFVGAIKVALEDFFIVAPSERSPTLCENLYAQLTAAARDLNLVASLRKPFEDIFGRFRKRSVGLGQEEKEQSKLRTKLRNDLKRWHTSLAGQLPRQYELADVYEAYQKALRERGRYDYADMILWVVERLQRDDELVARYQEQFQYILVDEYQDTNGAQNEVLRLLGSYDDRPNIFVVGDDQQSIYRFQGASLQNMLYFHESYKESVAIITLSQTYRSQQMILDVASTVISHNEESLGKYIPHTVGALRDATQKAARPLKLYVFDTETEENYFVAREVQRLIESGENPGSLVVLYRYHRDADDLTELFARLTIPYHLAAGEDALADPTIHLWLKFLQYLADPEQEQLLPDILQYEWLGLDPLDVLRLVHYTGKKRLSLLSVLSSSEHLGTAGISAPESFIDFARKVARWRAVRVNKTLMAWFDLVLQESGFLRLRTASREARPARRPDSDYVRLLNNLTSLFNEIKRLSYKNPHVTLGEFMRNLVLLQESGLPLLARPLPLRRRAVQLMTAHQAKGLEFEHVFIVRLVDRHWGNVRGRNKLPLPQGLLAYDLVVGEEHNEDERRLFYVALTRAREQVYLTYARHTEQEREQVPAVFLQELPEEYIERVAPSETNGQTLARLTATTLRPLPQRREGDIKEWLTEVLTHYVMSVTHLNNYLECPRLFYFRNLLLVPSAKTKSMAFGTAVHKTLRDVLDAFAARGRRPIKQYVLERFKHNLSAEVLTERDYRDSLAAGTTMLERYFDYYRTRLVPTALLEYNFRSHGVHVDTLRLTGQVDKIEVVEGKLVNVVDYKTGNPDTAASRLKPGGSYFRQLVFYKLLCDLSPRFPYTMTSGEVDFVQPSKRTGKLIKKRFEISRGDTEELTETIRRVWQEIQAFKFLEDDAGCGKCEYCKTV